MFAIDSVADGADAFSAQPLAPARGDCGASFAREMSRLRQDIERTVREGFARDAEERTIPYQRAAAFAPVLSGLAARPGGGAGELRDPAKQAFVTEILPFAQAASERLGVSPNLIAAHAALESGWGQRPIRLSSGEDSHNLFGIKANDAWRGSVAHVATSEFVAGEQIRLIDGFRAYPSYKAAFDDYTRLLTENPRYRAARGAGDNALAFASALAKAGYSTDPDYAKKFAHVAAALAPARTAQTAGKAHAAIASVSETAAGAPRRQARPYRDR